MTGKKKVVIIGGGMSGLATAFGLTSAPQWQDQYEITVLQLGWRLGGKGASGRNATHQQRIEEHGLHVWGGFYENAFRVIRACYTEMARPPGAPLATWDEAFKPSALVSWMEDLQSWLPWNQAFDEYPNSTPGDGLPMPTLEDGVLRIVEWVLETAFAPGFAGELKTASAGALPVRPPWVAEAVDEARQHAPQARQFVEGRPYWGTLSEEVNSLIRAAGTHPSLAKLMHDAAATLLSAFREVALPALARAAAESEGLRRAAILVDLGLAEVIGILKDGLLISGFDAVDNEDYMAWLARHGASPDSVDSAVTRGVYDFIFAYRGGDSTQPALAAGVGLRCVLRLVMWYKGAIFWKMQAGMGDVVFAPLYQVLSNRGVKFRFFQKVEHLGLSSDRTSIATIDVSEQVTLVNGSYAPLCEVNGLPCWPNQPLYDQLVQGKVLQQQGIDLEDPWANWTPVGQYTLRGGVDFDVAVLATSLGPLAELCGDLAAVSPAWTNMIANIATVQTQAFQLWMTPKLSALGWTAGSPVLTAYAHPDETWSDMTQLIPREQWPSGEAPGSIAYFCGALIDANPIPPYSDHGFPARQTALVAQNSIDWINANLPTIWPAGVQGGKFNWSLVDDRSGETGSARFDSQYWRANLSPAERYVLSVPGSTQYRLRPTGSGFANLYLAGDWTLNGLNFGCIESATMGGLEVSQAICGYPKEIVGTTDF